MSMRVCNAGISWYCSDVRQLLVGKNRTVKKRSADISVSVRALVMGQQIVQYIAVGSMCHTVLQKDFVSLAVLC